MSEGNLHNSINFIDISMEPNMDLVRWHPNGKSFPIDLLAARQSAKKDINIHHETNEKRTAFVKKEEFTFTIGSTPKMQFQELDAILDAISSHFLENFRGIPRDLLVSGIINGYTNTIPQLCEKAEREDVLWVKPICKLCKKAINIAVKKKLVTDAKNYPVSLVFFHEGHGILIELDANFKVRSAEPVDTSA
jgi:hypothetical protein